MRLSRHVYFKYLLILLHGNTNPLLYGELFFENTEDFLGIPPFLEITGTGTFAPTTATFVPTNGTFTTPAGCFAAFNFIGVILIFGIRGGAGYLR